MPGWLKSLIEVLAEVFLGWRLEQGRSEGKAQADAETKTEQGRRVEAANAARADAARDNAAGRVPARDPYQRD